ncbi:MAG: nucleotide exchange factor GrpE [Candidatus Omnitrophica bacterium]|nr:nucleotide exchange factor GrpE [Candidatus Omnitrophota bacterium]
MEPVEKTVTLKEEELNKLKEAASKAEEHYDKFLRLHAEFDNARKRWEKEKVEFAKYACEEIVLNLLSTVDNLERAIELAESKHEDFQGFLKGMEMVLAQLYELLRGHGLAPINTKGRPFDPNTQEALMQQESKDVDEGVVIEELQKGYMLNGKVIRTAKVKVSKKP